MTTWMFRKFWLIENKNVSETSSPGLIKLIRNPNNQKLVDCTSVHCDITLYMLQGEIGRVITGSHIMRHHSMSATRTISKQTAIRGLQYVEVNTSNSNSIRLSLTNFRLRYFSRRFSGNNYKNNSITTSTTPSITNPWKAVVDPKGSGLVYYWNPQTNETTALGS